MGNINEKDGQLEASEPKNDFRTFKGLMSYIKETNLSITKLEFINAIIQIIQTSIDYSRKKGIVCESWVIECMEGSDSLLNEFFGHNKLDKCQKQLDKLKKKVSSTGGMMIDSN